MEPEQALCELPTDCDWGFKKDTDGNPYRWRGYKAHIVWADGMIPLACVTTSASVHDSQSAIPLMKQVAQQVRSLYDLMDSAYDASSIRTLSQELGHVPLIDKNPRRGKSSGGLDDAKYWYHRTPEQSRYGERSNAERGNSRLKESFGLRYVRVRGGIKVHCHIMLGVVALFADQLLKPHPGQQESGQPEL